MSTMRHLALLGALGLFACGSSQAIQGGSDAADQTATRTDASRSADFDGRATPNGQETEPNTRSDSGGSPEGMLLDGSTDAGVIVEGADAEAANGAPCGDFVTAMCPTALPSSGQRCPAAGLTCEFGPTSFYIECNWTAVCGQECSWSPVAPYSNWHCSDAAAPGCPPTFALMLKQKGACMYPGSCDYPEGSCTCGASPDGGFSWGCYPVPPAGCESRHLVGAPCTQEGLDCGLTCGRTSEICKQGHWQSYSHQCG